MMNGTRWTLTFILMETSDMFGLYVTIAVVWFVVSLFNPRNIDDGAAALFFKAILWPVLAINFVFTRVFNITLNVGKIAKFLGPKIRK